MKTDIILAGVGGQGILSIATVLGAAALDEDLYIKQAEVHGMSQRGGEVQSCLRISSKPIASDLIPLRGADVIVSLEPMEALRYVEYLNPNTGWIVTAATPMINIDNYPPVERVMDTLHRYERVVAADVEAVAKQVATARAANMVLLGAVAPFVGIDKHKIEAAIAKIFEAKGANVVEMNITAFRAGVELADSISNKI